MKEKLLKIIKILIIILTILFFYLGYRYYRIITAKVEVNLIDNLEVEFNEKRKLSSFIEKINGKINDDFLIDSTKLGQQEIKFDYTNDNNIKVKYSFSIKVVDKTPPVIWLSTRYSLPINSDTKLTDAIMCGDNYDKNPKCYIEGDYDLSTSGEYSLVFIAEDSSKNTAKQEFVLNVYEPKKPSSKTNNSSNQSVKRTNLEDVIKTHKTKNTKIGIDVSKWQGDIDFKQVHDAGVEFVFIRVGGTRGQNGAYFIDEKFEKNIKNANKNGLKVGVYFYSYANSVKQAKKDANWTLKKIKNYKVDLGVAYDWEDWLNFNSYKASFYDLTNYGLAFMEVIEKAGYKSMLYSSKAYLENIWFEDNYDVWLAHYTSKTNYQKDYKYWQLCDNGKVPGINGNVDIDIMYID